jgi:phosphate starvation-inducible protein PhoH
LNFRREGIETLFGVHDQNIKYLESLLDVRVDARGQDFDD